MERNGLPTAAGTLQCIYLSLCFASEQVRCLYLHAVMLVALVLHILSGPKVLFKVVLRLDAVNMWWAV